MPNQPDILVFMTDDHGQWASHAYGCGQLHTPSLDYLANHGVRFDHGFTTSPVCSPARASFWTGKIPSAHGVHDFLQESPLNKTDHPGIGDQTMLAQRLKSAGYYTALSGKWHAGGAGVPQPGFDDWFASLDGTNAKFGSQRFSLNGEEVSWQGHQAPRVTDQAICFLRHRPEDQPAFVFVGYTNTHSPFTGEAPRLVDFYRNASFEDIPDYPYQGEHGYARQTLSRGNPEDREKLAQYYAAVTAIDEQVGRVLDELESQGRLDNTLIVYTADHGHMNGHHGLLCKGNTTIPQNMLEESIHVPHLAMWAGRIGAGQACAQPVDHLDLHATLCETAGIERDQSCPGRSYLPLVAGEQSSEDDSAHAAAAASWRDAQFSEYGNCRMIRTDRLKLIRRYPGPNGHFADELYDLQTDPDERRNVLDDPAYPDQIAQLDERLNDYFARYEDPASSGTRITDQRQSADSHPWEMAPG